ncbi:DUF2975 domain-containing protein [Runella limosa]|uniref:DUF2975 domain-containing protein n=1 Tax=Runella limosa TaxID=370978 RepID=UPI0003F7D0EE|nr:DUF2975 domain-containing protein [Runella limosa]
MTRKLFTQIVSVFYWICNLCIAFTVAAFLFLLFLQLSDRKETLNVGDTITLSQGSFSKPVFNIPIILDLQESFMDTTVVFRSKANSSYLPETYQVKTRGDFDDNHYAESLKKRNETLIQRYQKGLVFPSDTIVTTFSLTSDRVPTSPSTYFEIVTPKEAKGFLRLKASNMPNGWLIVACAWFKVIVESALLLFILFCINLFLQDIRKYEIFTTVNFRRLRWISLSLLAFSLLGFIDGFRSHLLENEIGRMATNFEVYRNQLSMPTPFKIRIDNTENFTFNPLLLFNSNFFMGLAIIILAEIFRKGHELQQEQELTI